MNRRRKHSFIRIGLEDGELSTPSHLELPPISAHFTGMRFPPSFLDDIRGRVAISSVVGRKVAWDRRKTNPGKGDYWACCPFQGEKSASFQVDDRNSRDHCFVCKASGDIFTFLLEKKGWGTCAVQSSAHNHRSLALSPQIRIWPGSAQPVRRHI